MPQQDHQSQPPLLTGAQWRSSVGLNRACASPPRPPHGSPGGLHSRKGQQSIRQPLPKPAGRCYTRPAQPLCTCSSTHPLQPPLRSIPARRSLRSHSPVKNIPLFK